MTEEVPEYEEKTCAHCEGLGCCFCDKKGKLLVKKPAKKCPHCDGVGCYYCGFTGWKDVKGKYDP